MYFSDFLFSSILVSLLCDDATWEHTEKRLGMYTWKWKFHFKNTHKLCESVENCKKCNDSEWRLLFKRHIEDIYSLYYHYMLRHHISLSHILLLFKSYMCKTAFSYWFIWCPLGVGVHCYKYHPLSLVKEASLSSHHIKHHCCIGTELFLIFRFLIVKKKEGIFQILLYW